MDHVCEELEKKGLERSPISYGHRAMRYFDHDHVLAADGTVLKPGWYEVDAYGHDACGISPDTIKAGPQMRCPGCGEELKEFIHVDLRDLETIAGLTCEYERRGDSSCRDIILNAGTKTPERVEICASCMVREIARRYIKQREGRLNREREEKIRNR